MAVYFVITAAVIIVAVIVYGTVFRRKIYKEVDALETRKTTIASQPVAEEIAKVKGLTMSGETEEKFEHWRSEWEEILGVHLPNIEEALFDIEEWANTYRFQKAREIIKKVDHELNEIDSMVRSIFDEVEELLQSEEESRANITDTKERYESMQKFISQNWRSLGETALLFEEKLKAFKETFAEFEEETESGNYIKANHIIKELNQAMSMEEERLKKVPVFFVELESHLPEEIKELELGMKQMEAEGYPLDHYDFRYKVTDMLEELKELSQLVSELELERVEDRMSEIRSYLDHIYDALEKEAESRLFVEENIEMVRNNLTRLDDQLEELANEKEKVRVSYRIPEEEERRQEETAASLAEQVKNWNVFQDMFEHQKLTFVGLRENLEELKKATQKLEKNVQQSKENLYMLRKDELKAMEALKSQRRLLLKDKMSLQKSMLPKVPSTLLNELDAAEEHLEAVRQALSEVPIEMGKVSALSEDAEQYVTKVHQQLKATMRQAQLAEKVIQYGNKYRSQSNTINDALLRAEENFRHGYYDEAVTIAVQALQERDPGVLDKVRNNNFTTL